MLLQTAMQVLGPKATCECMGCAWEIDEALRCLRAVGIEYIPRKRKRTGGPKHNRAAERRGNAIVEYI